jgi:hypothetical protein
MSQAPQILRDFGLIPDRVGPPPAVVRARFAAGDLLWQYGMTGCGLLFAGAMILTCAAVPLFPGNILLSLAALGISAFVIYFSVRHKYVWVELAGDTIRARHFFTRRTHERSVPEIDHIETLVMEVQSPLTTAMLHAVYGRVRGYLICFSDRRWPVAITRVDPALVNAQELIEAIVYRMSQHSELDAEVVEYRGSPLMSKIHWRASGQSAPTTPDSC